ncbi:hypothetical protein BBJ28_00022277 [Nothophytophthora sp. Chile5]|nr:hypothetical protein BBJ28_00022277 [Nothophytophthora sp. Chile5]
MTTRKGNSFSLFAETAEEFIKLECARRRNQGSLRRRSSLSEQFHVLGHKSGLKERLAQTRHHTFLLRSDNKAALVAIVDTVRDLAGDGDDVSVTRRSVLSPMEHDRFLNWASAVEKLLFEFQPSENHDSDPMLRVLEHLQFLQDGHVCLAEVAVDARALLERWDRSGVFDSDESSSDDDDTPRAPTAGPERYREHDGQRCQEQSYAYQNIKQRAAASVIKRNVLRWVRANPSFCDRVAEIQVFGRTTAGLLKELTRTAPSGAGHASASTDIFALATGRRDPRAGYSGSISFHDLLHFSKHLALFPVDQALRSVEQVTHRRFLFDTRCVVKIQCIWRRVRQAVQARRRHRAAEELRLQREREEQAKREAARERKLEANRSKTRRTTLKRSSTASRLSGSSKTGESPERRASKLAADRRKQSMVPTPPAPDSSSGRTGGRDSVSSVQTDRARQSLSSPPRSHHRPSLEVQSGEASNNDSDGDTKDVEGGTKDVDGDTKDVEVAWQSFLDTVAAEEAAEAAKAMEASIAAATEAQMASSSSEERVVDPPALSLPQIEENWEAWSDEEDEESRGNHEDLEAEEKVTQRLIAATLSSAVVPVQIVPMKVMVSVAKSDSSVAQQLPDTAAIAVIDAPAVVRPPSSLPFDAAWQTHSGPYSQVGQLSVMAPFVDSAARSKPSKVTARPQMNAATERKHLYELDFSGVGRRDVKVNRIAASLVTSEDLGPLQELETAPNLGLRREVVVREGPKVDTPLSEQEEEEDPEASRTADQPVKEWRRSMNVQPRGLAGPRPPTGRLYPSLKRKPQVRGRQIIELKSMDLEQAAAAERASPRRVDKHSDLPLLLRRSRAAARRRRLERPSEEPEEAEEPVTDVPAPDISKQTWKRGGELPALALAQIPALVGEEGRAGAVPAIDEENSEGSDEDEDELEDDSNDPSELDVEEDRTTEREAQQHKGEDSEVHEPVSSNESGSPREAEGDSRQQRDDMSEEFRRLHLARREREQTHRLHLLATYQSGTRSKEHKKSQPKTVQQERRTRKKRRHRRDPRVEPSVSDSDEVNDSDDHTTPELKAVLGDEPGPLRRQVRVKNRKVNADLAAVDLSDEEDGDSSSRDQDHDDGVCLSKEQRDAAFQKLLTQYLGLLHCPPPEIERRLTTSQ